MMMAQFIALAFLTLFLYVRPYRRGFFNFTQMLAMIAPIVGTSYGLAGGWERMEEQATAAGAGTDTDDVEFDSTALVVLHAVIIGGPFFIGLFTIVSTVYIWYQSRRHDDEASAIAKAAKKEEKTSLLPRDVWKSASEKADKEATAAVVRPAQLV